MKIRFLIATLALFLSTLSIQADDKTVLEHLQAISWPIEVEGVCTGSGVLFTKGDKHFVVTAGHLFDSCQKVNKVIDPATGKEKWQISYPNTTILLTKTEHTNGKMSSKQTYYCDLIRHSHSDFGGEDLAILKVRKTGLTKHSVEFVNDIPSLGTAIWHVGSTFGPKVGENTTSNGIFSNQDRTREDKLFDQVTISADYGSSGGGTFLKSDGRCIGLVLQKNPGCVAHMVYIRPSREIHKWTKKVGMEFLFNSKLPLPTDEEIGKLPICDTTIPLPSSNPFSIKIEVEKSKSKRVIYVR